VDIGPDLGIEALTLLIDFLRLFQSPKQMIGRIDKIAPIAMSLSRNCRGRRKG
jgi:hypothetical protein